ncbi:MAG: ABC transporter substrate-binding protein [Opitutaceae bacterium]|nr:ABC transporter substrate-binding protein [Opitutaceae bacterium]
MNPSLDSTDLTNDDPVFPETENNQRRRLDFLGHAPCPLRNELRQRLHRHFRALEAKGEEVPAWFMPAGCHSPNPYDELWLIEDAAGLPDVISENGFGDYNRPEFLRRWFDTGMFGRVEAGSIRPEFHEAGLVDPKGQFHVYGAVPEVLLVDLARLGDRPVPRTWADVLHPRFRHEVIISGEPGEIHESIVYGLGRDHGEAGLAALGANVREFFHPAEMAKMAGTANPKGAALYILPNFFAKSCPHRAATRIVWPEEGVYLNPLYLFRKAAASPAASAAVDYLTGADWAAHLSKVGFAAGRADAPALPGKLRWVGWDYVRTNDLTAVAATMNAAFVRGYEAGR